MLSSTKWQACVTYTVSAIFILSTGCGHTKISGDADSEDDLVAEVLDSEEDFAGEDVAPPDCGNGVVETGEACDDGPENSDTLPDACREDCTNPGCGDSVVDTDDECDGDDLDGNDCEDLGFDGGVLSCDPYCVLDDSRCGYIPECVRYVSVDTTASSPDGLTWLTAFSTVQQGIDSAYDATPAYDVCEVWVAEGTYLIYESSNMDTVQLRVGVHVYGGFYGTEIVLEERDWESHPTVLDGRLEAFVAVLHVVTGSDESRIDGFTITGGDAYTEWEEPVLGRFGGGMLNHEASPTVANCTFMENDASSGGGMCNYASSPLVVNCKFISNSAYIYGGGIANFASSVSTILQCVFENNDAVDGGGMLNSESSVDVINTEIVGNHATRFGGGIISNSGSATITNCILQSNDAVEDGGGIWNDGTLAITNCTFFGNIAGIDGGGMINRTRWPPSTTMVINSIFWGNEPNEIVDDAYASLYVSYSNIEGTYEGEGNIDENPLFLDPDGGDFNLLPGSPCIDASDGNAAPGTDIKGHPRYDDLDVPDTGVGIPTYVDIGAHERQP
jgi:hypothetical protein